jgi:hypothetical protein
MFNGPNMIPQLSLPVSRTTPDVSQTNFVSYSDFNREPPKPDTRTLGEQLFEARFRMVGAASADVSRCDQLLLTYSELELQIKEFLVVAHQRYISQLEAQRAELWRQCREIEDTVGAHTQEIGILLAQKNSQGQAVSSWRASVQEAAQPQFSSRFPTPDEISIWKQRQGAARAKFANALSRQQQLARALSAAQVQREGESRALAAKVEELRACDRELMAAQQVK